jgi:hypothetical protein
MPNTLDLINNVCSLIGERPLASSTGSLGGIVRSALNNALYTVAQNTRSAEFEKFITFNATNSDYTVPIGTLPSSVVKVREVSFRTAAPNVQIYKLSEQDLDLLPYWRSYTIIGNNVYLSPMINRPVIIYLLTTNVPTLNADGDALPFSDALVGAVSHTAAAILCVSYIDDPNAAALHSRISNDLIVTARNNTGVGRGRKFNMGGVNV